MDKQCTNASCKLVKDIKCFYKNKSRKDGLSDWCKICTDTRNKTYYARKDMARVAQKVSYTPDKYNVPRGYQKCSNEYCARSFPADDVRYWPEGGTVCRRCNDILSNIDHGIVAPPSPEQEYQVDGKPVTFEEWEKQVGEIL